ncbi:DUF6538 domain-containing protein [Marinospirillum sp. MEB164]|uniref:DUF6538 domain-containing protein n=1 Tax=Marinospirillum alkalitolerans TaxID=3123374 RepID=A0ABW8PX07_9GAMM
MAKYILRNRHGNTFHCRLKVPKALRPLTGFSEVRRSLHTEIRVEALKRARPLRVAFDIYLERLQKMTGTWTPEELEQHHNDLIEKMNKAIRFDPEATKDLTPDELLEFADELEKTEALARAKKREVKLSAMLPPEQPAPRERSTEKTEKVTLLGLATERLEWLNKTEPRQERSRKSTDLKAAIRYWEEFKGDIPLRHLRPQMVREFVDWLKTNGYAYSTVKDSMGAFRRMLERAQTAKAHHLKGANPFAEVEIPKPDDSRKDNEKRKCFSDSETLTLLDAVNGKSGTLCAESIKKEPYLRWMPLLATYNGARNGELLFLTGGDVKQCPKSGIWFVEFANRKANNGVLVQSVKNKNSSRKVPLHSEIIKAGFLDYCKGFDSEQFLFWAEGRSLSNDALTAASVENFSKKVIHSLREKVLMPLGLHESNVKTFYSLRHTVINHLYWKQYGKMNGAELFMALEGLVGHLDKDDRAGLALITKRHYLKNKIDHLEKLAEFVELIHYDSENPTT